jgi:DNA-binding transcriptional ArsR family regulator
MTEPRPEIRRRLDDAEAIEALAHPVRLNLLGYLMSEGPATASACARAVGDSPSNCSYHLRVLAKHGLVEPVDSGDGRERPWRATVTGLDTHLDSADPDLAASAEGMIAAALQLEYQLAREHLRTRERLEPEWRETDAHMTYGLRVTPAELRSLVESIDALLRPYIAATRGDAPDGSAVAEVSVLAFPRPSFGAPTTTAAPAPGGASEPGDMPEQGVPS